MVQRSSSCCCERERKRGDEESMELKQLRRMRVFIIGETMRSLIPALLVLLDEREIIKKKKEKKEPRDF